MTWTHYNPVAIHAGPGSIAELPRLLPGGKALLVTTEGMVRRGTAYELMDRCSGVTWSAQMVPPNPDLDMLDTIATWHRDANVDAVVALGGGSAMDSAKALAAILSMPGETPLSYWLREGRPRGDFPVLPLVFLPTTSGTGAEVTPFGTIWDTAFATKRSVAHPALFAKAAILDPELTLSLPWAETLYGAMDTLSHAMETLWNKNATPASLALATGAIPLVREALPTIRNTMRNLRARDQLQQASLLAGLAISQSRTAIAHAMSYPLTIHFGVPHGLACSFTLPAIAAMVTERGLWPSPAAEQAAKSAATFIADYGLGALVLEHCAPDDVFARMEEMFPPDRADNLVFPAYREDVLVILRQSLA